MFEAEPLAQLGVGIVTYIHILWTLCMIFFVFSILLLPSMNHYSGGVGYKGDNPEFIQYEQGFLGNMGYSSVQCSSVEIDVGKLNINCPYGGVGKIIGYGVNLDSESAGNCASANAPKQCIPDSSYFTGKLDSAIGKETFIIPYDEVSDDDPNWEALYASPSDKSKCMVAASRLFVQYSCVQSLAN